MSGRGDESVEGAEHGASIPSQDIQDTRERRGLPRLPDPREPTAFHPRYGFDLSESDERHLAAQEAISATVVPGAELLEATHPAFAGAHMDLAGHRIVVLETLPGALPRAEVAAVFLPGAPLVVRDADFTMVQLRQAFDGVMAHALSLQGRAGLNSFGIHVALNRVAVTVVEGLSPSGRKAIEQNSPAVRITGSAPLPAPEQA